MRTLKKVFLTGAAGFIGSRTAQFLLDQQIEVVAVDNLNNYYDPKLKEHRLIPLNQSKLFHFYPADIENLSQMREIFQAHQKQTPFDAIINLAARAGVRYSMENPHIYLSTNAQGTLNLLELAREFAIGKFTLASTSSLYAGCQMPFNEELAVNTPISPYAASKKAAEAMCYSYHSLYQLDVSVVRYFTVFGPAGRPDMSLYRFIKWIQAEKAIELYGDGTQSRDFTFVDDIARGTIAATTHDVGYEVINLGGGRNPVTLLQIIEKLEKLIGKKAIIDFQPAHCADLKETWADIQKAHQLLHWKPEISLDEGLAKTVQWHRDFDL